MFSDTIFDALENILEDLKPDYAYITVYDPQSVIDMLACMYFNILLSDCYEQDMPEARRIELRQLAELRAETVYNNRMNNIEDNDAD